MRALRGGDALLGLQWLMLSAAVNWQTHGAAKSVAEDGRSAGWRGGHLRR